MDDGLHHRAEDVRIDLRPVQFGALEDDRARLRRELGHSRAMTEEAAIDVSEVAKVRRQVAAITHGRVEDLEELIEEGVKVGAVLLGQ